MQMLREMVNWIREGTKDWNRYEGKKFVGHEMEAFQQPPQSNLSNEYLYYTLLAQSEGSLY